MDAIESYLEAREKVSALKLRKPRYAGLNIYESGRFMTAAGTSRHSS